MSRRSVHRASLQQTKPAYVNNTTRRVAWLATAVGLMVGSLLFAPAHWLTSILPSATQGRLQILNPKGTLWQGQADLALTGGLGSRDATTLPQGIQWRLNPTWDNGPALRLELHAPCCTPTPMIWLTSGSSQGFHLQLKAHQSQWPTEWLVGLGSPWNTLRLQGQIELQTPGASINWSQGRTQLNGSFEITAHHLASSLSTLRPLGSYKLHLESDSGGGPLLTLHTLQGALSLSGQGQWTGGRLRFRGLAEAQKDSESVLSNLLNILGRRDGSRAHMSLG